MPRTTLSQVAKSASLEFGSPPWTMKPGITRWNFVPT